MLPEDRITDDPDSPTVADIRGAVKRAEEMGAWTGWTWSGISIEVGGGPRIETAPAVHRSGVPA